MLLEIEVDELVELEVELEEVDELLVQEVLLEVEVE